MPSPFTIVLLVMAPSAATYSRVLVSVFASWAQYKSSGEYPTGLLV